MLMNIQRSTFNAQRPRQPEPGSWKGSTFFDARWDHEPMRTSNVQRRTLNIELKTCRGSPFDVGRSALDVRRSDFSGSWKGLRSILTRMVTMNARARGTSPLRNSLIISITGGARYSEPGSWGVFTSSSIILGRSMFDVGCSLGH